jgi:hypothetical protein
MRDERTYSEKKNKYILKYSEKGIFGKIKSHLKSGIL